MRASRTGYWFVVCLLFSSACTVREDPEPTGCKKVTRPPEDPGYGSVEGTILLDGEPQAHRVVELRDYSDHCMFCPYRVDDETVSDEHGFYRIEGLRVTAAHWGIRLKCLEECGFLGEGYTTYRTVRIRKNDTTTYDFEETTSADGL